MKRRELEMALQGLEGFEEPDPKLEQYSTPAVIAADILYTAAGNGDITGRDVIDLGCGNGIFAIGAFMLGAKQVVGIDIDPSAIRIAERNSTAMDCGAEFLCTSIDHVEGKFDTCIQNPPFGAQNRHADVPFLRKALSIASTVYTIHNSRTERFVQKEIVALGGNVASKKNYQFEIKHIFDFHRKERETFNVTLFRIEM